MSLLFKMADAAKVMFTSGRGIASMMRPGASVASVRILHNCGLYIPRLSTVVDVGANKGQFALAAAHRYPDAKIFSFEPVPEVYRQLQHNTRATPAIATFNCALGNSNGTLEFFSHVYSHASSALKVSDLQQQLMPQTADARRIQVVVKRLDSLRAELPLQAPVLLKLDVQGFEKEVLLGASHSLAQVDYLLFETSFVRMYEEEPLFDEMHDFVKSHGFELVAPVGFLQSEQLQILQMDLLYKKRR